MEEKMEKTPPGAPSAAIDLYPLSPEKPISMMKQAVPGPVSFQDHVPPTNAAIGNDVTDGV